MSLWQLFTLATRLEKEIELFDLEESPLGEKRASEDLRLRAVVLLWLG